MVAKNSFYPIILKSINSSAISSGSYSAINPAGLSNPCSLIFILNRSSNDIFVSFDGSNDHDYIPSEKELALEVPYRDSYFSELSKIYVRGVAGTGSIYLSAYAQNE